MNPVRVTWANLEKAGQRLQNVKSWALSEERVEGASPASLFEKTGGFGIIIFFSRFEEGIQDEICLEFMVCSCDGFVIMYVYDYFD